MSITRVNIPSFEKLGSEPASENGSDSIDLRGIWFVILRRMRIITAIFAVVLAVAALMTFQIKDVYTAEARILIDPRDREIINAGVVSDLRPDSTIMDTEVQLILSRAMMNRVTGELELAKDPEFNPLLVEPVGFAKIIRDVRQGMGLGGPGPTAGAENTGTSGTPQPERRVVSSKVRLPSDAAETIDEDQRPAPAIDPSAARDGAADEDLAQKLSADSLQRSIKAWREGLTFVINVNATTEDPQKSARIVNELVDSYIRGQVDLKVSETESAGDWLESRLAVLREEVRQSESAVQEFRNAQGLIETGGVSTIEAKVGSLTSQLLVLQADLTEKELRYEEARRTQGSDAASARRSEVIDSQMLTTLRIQRSDLARSLAQISVEYDSLHPERVRATNQLAELDQAIEAERSRVLSSIASEVQVARSRVAAVESQLATLTRQLTNNNVDMIRQRELEREANASREIYEALLNRAEQITQASQLQRSDAFVVSVAEAPTQPSAPNHKMNLALGGLFALALAGIVVLLLEVFESGVVTSDDLERHIGLPLIATVAKAPVSKLLSQTTADRFVAYMASKPYSAYSESIRTIYAALYRSRDKGDPIVVAMTSSLPGEGKTTLSLSLAKVAAAQGDRVLLIDADIHRHALSSMLAPAATTGFSEVLDGRATPADAIVRDEANKFSILPALTSAEGSMNVILKDRCKTLFDSLRKDYDFIVIDCPPVLPVLEARTIGAAADTVLFATRWRKTHRRAAQRAVSYLETEGASILGVVLTRADLRSQALYDRLDGSHFKLYTAYYRN